MNLGKILFGNNDTFLKILNTVPPSKKEQLQKRIEELEKRVEKLENERQCTISCNCDICE
jgi:tetrahydromethanopterin S-methyltransferase subunit G